MPYCPVIIPHLPPPKPTPHPPRPPRVAKKKLLVHVPQTSVCSPSRVASLCFIFLLEILICKTEKRVVISANCVCSEGATSCYASPVGITEKGIGKGVFILNWMYTIVSTNHCFCSSLFNIGKMLCLFSPLSQTLHSVSQPFVLSVFWLGLASNQCVESWGNGGFAHCSSFYFCSLRVYQLRASIAPSPFVQCLNQIKHLWWSVSKFTCRSQRKVPVMDGESNRGEISYEILHLALMVLFHVAASVTVEFYSARFKI